MVTAALIHDMEKHCNIEIAAQISHLPSQNNGICVLQAYEYFLFIFVFIFLNEPVECFFGFLFGALSVVVRSLSDMNNWKTVLH